MSETKETKTGKGLKDLNLSSMAKGLKYPGLFIVGMFAGNQVAIFIDKAMSTPKVQGVLGIEGKKFVKPAVLGLGGMALAQLSSDPNFKFIGYGIASAGLYHAVKDFWDKDILHGVGELNQLPPYDENMLISGPSESSALNLEELSQAMEIIDKAVEEESASGVSGGGNKSSALGKTSLGNSLAGEEDEKDVTYS